MSGDDFSVGSSAVHRAARNQELAHDVVIAYGHSVRRGQHGGADLRTAAWTSIPGFEVFDRAIARAGEHRNQLIEAMRTRIDFTARAVESFLDDRDEPDLVADLAADRQRILFQNEAQKVLLDVERRLEQLRARFMFDHADQALDYLRPRLEKLASQLAQTATALDGVSTPEDAIAAGPAAAAAWSELHELVGEYEQLRAAQSAITHSGMHQPDADRRPTDVMVALHGVFREAAKYQPLAGEMTKAGSGPHPWPSDTRGALLWFAQTGVTLWLPSLDELRGASRAHLEAVSRAAAERVQPYESGTAGTRRAR